MPPALVRSAVVGAVLTAGLSACGGEETCILPPCAVPVAVTVRLQSSVPGHPLDGPFVRADGNDVSCSISTSVVCQVVGSARTYELEIGAAGFQTVHRSVKVEPASTARCGCPGAQTQELDVSLSPAA